MYRHDRGLSGLETEMERCVCLELWGGEETFSITCMAVRIYKRIYLHLLFSEVFLFMVVPRAV